MLSSQRVAADDADVIRQHKAEVAALHAHGPPLSARERGNSWSNSWCARRTQLKPSPSDTPAGSRGACHNYSAYLPRRFEYGCQRQAASYSAAWGHAGLIVQADGAAAGVIADPMRPSTVGAVSSATAAPFDLVRPWTSEYRWAQSDEDLMPLMA